MTPPRRIVVAGALVVVALACVVGLRLTSVSRSVAAAQRALDAADLVTAETAWRAVLAEDPGRAEALYGLGWTLHLAAETDGAREAFQQCVEAHPESPLGYKGLGSVAMGEGNPTLARRRFEEALARAPGDTAVRHSLALLDLLTGRADEAVVTFEALAAEEPTHAAFQQALGEALVAVGRPEEALEAATRAVELAADDDRGRALAQLTRARAILAATSGRVDTADCAGTAPPVYAWLEEADRALDEAEATQVPLPDLVAARRAIRQRRGAVDDQCPGARVSPESLGRKLPDG
ncbi:MAG: tetratricopeptide repeat protein [Pseudomonadota bacterium]|nr:tetratricopeptide repeat protein [Pseudomonadota bacterium]